ncbi:hypothetical protein, partial [Flavobacterium sp.]|uniref:hypothetical protein n=1 Tax=Flavobacterium sp. TaxID=239 RepID=UPI0037529985
EIELIKNGIDFYVDLENQPSIFTDISYFSLDRDKIKMDSLLKETQIIAGTETIGLIDYSLEKKIRYLYFKFFIIVLLIMILIVFYDFFKS